MTETVVKTVKWVATNFASAAMLLSTMAGLPASAQTMEEAAAAFGRGDYSAALAGFRFYAEQGDPRAQFFLGGMYANGHGVPEDDTVAARWFRLAAEQGDASAQSILGTMYVNGYGVPRGHRRGSAVVPPRRQTGRR